MRGTIGYLVRAGRSLLSAALHGEATQHVIRHMSITDPEEQTFVAQIVGEQQAAMGMAQTVSQMNMPYSVEGIPTSITIPLQSPGVVQYMVIVEIRNPVTGETIDVPITLYDDIAMSSGDIFARAQVAVEQRDYGEKYKARISGDEQPQIATMRLISVSRRV